MARIESADPREIPVPDGSITCYVMPKTAPSATGPSREAGPATAGPSPGSGPATAGPSPAGLPIVFLPGFGGGIEGFTDVIENIDPGVDLYYLETREKASSRLSAEAELSMDRIALDVADAVSALGLADEGYVLFGSSFGASVALHMVACRGTAARGPKLTVLFEPMPELWGPGRLIAAVGRFVPLLIVERLRRALKRLVLAGMKEETQRRRAERVIDEADLRKWREAALSLSSWHILDVAPIARGRVEVIHASRDRFHAQTHYPKIAAALRDGHLHRIPTDESERERLMGRLASDYALGRR